MAKYNVLVTGATGAVGTPLVQALLKEGHTVIGVALDTQSPTVDEGFIYERCDVTDLMSVDRILEAHRPDTLIHLAALVHVRDSKLSFSDYSRVNYRSSEQLFSAAQSKGVGRIVFASTVEVYGPTPDGALIDETCPCQPDSDYARTKLLAEESLRAIGDGAALDYAILRFAPVYSSTFRLNLDKRLYLHPHNVGYYVGRGSYALSLCSVENIVLFVTRWLAKPRPGTFNLADQQSYSVKELLRLERRAGRARIVLPIPYWPALTALSFIEAALNIAGRKTNTLSAANIRKLIRSPRWSTARALDVVGQLPGKIETALTSNGQRETTG